MPQPTLELLTPHNATILADPELGFDEQYLDSQGKDRVARARSFPRQIGAFTLEGHEFPFFSVQLGDPHNLPPQRHDKFYVVSKLTIQAALRAGRTIQDLFFLYNDQRQANRYLGVLGLGRPQPVLRPRSSLTMPKGVLTREWRNTCPYPAKLYPPGTPEYIDNDTQPAVTFDVPESDGQTYVQYEDALNEHFTGMFGLPVYDTAVAGVHGNHAPNPNPNTDTLLWANPNVLLALGTAAVDYGYAVLEPGVRAQDTGSLLGGAGAGMYGESVLCGPLI